MSELVRELLASLHRQIKESEMEANRQMDECRLGPNEYFNDIREEWRMEQRMRDIWADHMRATKPIRAEIEHISRQLAMAAAMELPPPVLIDAAALTPPE